MRAPARRVVIITEDGSTAKCTMPTLPRVRFWGGRSLRYWATAFSTLWPVSGFFSSAVATGTPLTNGPRSTVRPLDGSNGSCLVTDSTLAS